MQFSLLISPPGLAVRQVRLPSLYRETWIILNCVGQQLLNSLLTVHHNRKARAQRGIYMMRRGCCCTEILSEECIRSVRGCLSLFQKRNRVPFRLCLRLLGLMSLTVSVIPLELLRMREFQHWTAAQCLCPKCHLNRKMIVTSLCVHAIRQYHGSGIHKSPWRHMLPSASQSGMENDRVGHGAFSFTTGNACVGGSPVQTKSSVWRMDSTPSGCEPVVGVVWPSCCRSLRLAQKHSLTSILLPGERRCTYGCGCSGQTHYCICFLH